MLTVRSGYWFYDGTVRLPVRIVQSPIRYGSGDHEDEADVRDDRVEECVYLVFTTSDGKEVGGGASRSVEEAINVAMDLTNGTAVFEK
ncbi:MAG: hypothetical protein JWN51_868 [Phycisphaerales bacterium]|nr:hypothetical protein [Phycisphaerales bacterium]